MIELLAELSRRDIKLWREGDDLRFSAPAGALTSELRAELGAQKAALLAHLAEKSAPIPRADRSASLPLSFAQERLWILDRLDPGLATYSIPHCWRMTGPLDASALERALDEITRRHEILRTTFRADDAENPAQVIHPFAPRPLPILTAKPEELAALAREEAARPFDLGNAPAWRTTLLRLGENDHALLLTWHHIISDSWSDAVFARELCALYSAFREGQPSPLSDLPIQYGDFARWQRDTFDSSAPRLAYWRERLAGEHAPLALPCDRPRPARQSYRGASCTHDLSAPLAAEVRQLARQENVTPFMLLLAAFNALLFRHTGETDFCVGTPIAQRPREETEPLIGFFLNMLALRTDLAGDPSFRELLKRVRAMTLDAFEHQDVPFEKVVEELQPPRHLSHQPLFQTVFVLQPDDAVHPALPGLIIEPLRTPATTAKFDLTLFVENNDGGLRATMEYSTDQFDVATIDRLLASFTLLLEGAVTKPGTTLSRLPILGDEERRKILVEWNRTERPCPLDRTVSELFEQQVAQTPEAVAIIDGAERLTYAELNARANRWAHDLRAQGIGAGDLIGLPAIRSAAFLERMLGILKAGGAYVPLSPDDPPERAARMRADCRMVLDLDALPAGDATANLRQTSAAGGAAYVLYTSGSTGMPKGVVVPHRAITRLVLNTDFVQMREDDIVALASNLCFDAATFEIWGAMLNGGALVVTPPDVLISPTALAEHLASHRITTLFLTTSLFNQVAQQSPAIFAALRNVVFGGEAADPHSANLVLQHGKPERLVNGYGPTETTTFAICHLVECADGPRLPIGRPIANTTAFIFDAALEPVPIGVAGDLYIGGPGLALGYLAKPELTAERFIETAHGRLYRTGDRARWLADGTIDYLGRADRQIKMRGFRIEPVEIETALRAQPGVAECVVRVREFAPGDQRLVAWVRPTNGQIPPDAELARGLAGSLPDYMVPSAFVPVEQFPLTANGKLDLDALPAPSSGSRESSGYVAPENSLQGQLAEIWQEVLGIPQVGIREDFFALGGHSLLAARMLALIEQRLGLRLPLATLFEDATIEHIGRTLLEDRKLAAQEAPYILIHGGGLQTPFFFMHGDFIGGGIFCQSIARQVGADRPFYAIHPHGLRGRAPLHSIEAMARARLETIRELHPHGPYLLGGYCNGALVAYEVARLLEADGERVEALIMLAADGSNARFRKLRDWADRIGTRFWEADEQRQKRFLRWQRRLRSSSILSAIHDLSFAEIPGRVWDKIKRLSHHVEAPPSPVASPVSAQPHDALASAYQDIWDSYVPNSYGGKATLLWPEQDSDILPLGPTAGWQELCGSIETIIVPGAHHTCITHDANLRVLGGHIRRVLDASTK